MTVAALALMSSFHFNAGVNDDDDCEAHMAAANENIGKAKAKRGRR